MMQSRPHLDLLGLGGMQGETFIQTYYITKIICTNPQSNVFINILRLDLLYKAFHLCNWLALELDKEGHPYKHIKLQISYVPNNNQTCLQVF